MKNSFNSATVIDFQLPTESKKALWKSGFLKNRAIADIIIQTSAAGIYKTEFEIYNWFENIKKIVSTAQKYAHDFFPNARIPDAAYYNLLREPAIDCLTNMPEEAQRISSESAQIASGAKTFKSPDLHPATFFCHFIRHYTSLSQFYLQLQNGSLPLPPGKTNNFYNLFIEPAKKIYIHETDHEIAMQELTRKIDFVFNYYDDPLFWFIEKAHQDKEKVFDKGGLVKSIGIPSNAIDTFMSAYSIIEDGEAPSYEAFYALAQSAINPMSLLMNQKEALSKNALKYIFAHSILTHDYDRASAVFDKETRLIHEAYLAQVTDEHILKSLGVRPQDFRLISNAMVMTDFIQAASGVWGPEKEPVFRKEHIKLVHELLHDSENIKLKNIDLANFWYSWRQFAARQYNDCTILYSQYGFEPYRDPVMYPANDVGPSLH